MRGIMPGSLGLFPLSWVTGTSTTLVYLSRKDGVYHTLTVHPPRCLRFPGAPEAWIPVDLAGFLVVAKSGFRGWRKSQGSGRPINSIQIAIRTYLHPCL